MEIKNTIGFGPGIMRRYGNAMRMPRFMRGG